MGGMGTGRMDKDIEEIHYRTGGIEQEVKRDSRETTILVQEREQARSWPVND